MIGDVTQAAYPGPWLWKLAVEKAGRFDVDKIAVASGGIVFDKAPEGYVRIHDANHHLWSRTRVGRARTDGQFDVIYETPELIEPNPFPEGYQQKQGQRPCLRTPPEAEPAGTSPEGVPCTGLAKELPGAG